MPDQIWPLFGLRITTPRLELRPPTDAELEKVAAVAARGVHGDDEMPFLIPWTHAPSPLLERNAFQFWWRTRGEWTPERWHLCMAVLEEGEPIGMQDLMADDFLVRRTVETGSWLGRAHQGRGIGKEMRTAVLHLAFEGLEATRSETGAWFDNPASQGVTTALGYEPNGDRVLARLGRPTMELRYKMEREGFERIRRDDITISGLEPCLPLFGLDPA